jgi:hypothetical protein
MSKQCLFHRLLMRTDMTSCRAKCTDSFFERVRSIYSSQASPLTYEPVLKQTRTGYEIRCLLPICCHLPQSSSQSLARDSTYERTIVIVDAKKTEKASLHAIYIAQIVTAPGCSVSGCVGSDGAEGLCVVETRQPNEIRLVTTICGVRACSTRAPCGKRPSSHLPHHCK